MKRTILPFLTAVLLLLTLALPVLANAAEPPCFTILVNGAPEDLVIYLVRADGVEEPLLRSDRGWESYYRCLYHTMDRSLDMEDIRHSTLRIRSSDVDVGIHIPVELSEKYNTIFQLKWPDIVLEEVYLVWRTPLLVTMRVLITLVTEGIVLWLFGYRMKRTWIVFLCTNLVTQTLLNLSLTGVIPPNGYWILGYIFGEILIFIAESIAYALLFREKSRSRAAGTAVCANLVSLLTGAFLLTYLPL